MTEIVKCGICGRTELREDFGGKVGGVGIILNPKRREHRELGERFGVDFDAYEGILSSGYCKDCLEAEREIAMKTGRVYCCKHGHGRHYFWSKQFGKCLRRGNLIFNETELYEIMKEWR